METQIAQTFPQIDVAKLTPDQVTQVYVGKPGKCCCGCSGKHSYNSKHAKRPDEVVNDREVKRVLALMQAYVNSVDANDDPSIPTYVSVEVGTKQYIVYVTPDAALVES